MNHLQQYLASLVLFFIASACYAYGPYAASVVRVIDGDTIELDVHIWPGLVQRTSLRLDGINTPETSGAPECEKEAAAVAKQFVADAVASGEISVTNISTGKYAGRMLGDILVNGASLSESLLENGLAVPYDGGKRKQWCE